MAEFVIKLRQSCKPGSGRRLICEVNDTGGNIRDRIFDFNESHGLPGIKPLAIASAA